SAPVKGIARLPLSMLKLAFSVLGKSLSNKAASLTAQQFRRAFTNSLTESESLDAFNRYTVPAPNRVLLQTAFANFSPHSATTVNFRNDTRAPFLLVAATLTNDPWPPYTRRNETESLLNKSHRMQGPTRAPIC